MYKLSIFEFGGTEHTCRVNSNLCNGHGGVVEQTVSLYIILHIPIHRHVEVLLDELSTVVV